ncbi:MAG: transglycosylase SLT domain-containing protein [Pikeienuella sp.]
MKKYIAALCGVLALGGCFGGSTSVPRDQTNACNILAGRSDWGEALADARSKWGAPPEVVMAIIWKESSFRSDARTPKKYTFFGLIPNGRVSSAYGYSQALNGTWEWYQDETGNGWADREDFGDATDFIGWYMTKTRRSNKLAMTDAYHQYLAYHEGHTGFRRGGWKSNEWLKGAAAKVSTRAAAYGRQLQGCSHYIA